VTVLDNRTISGNIVDLIHERIFPGTMEIGEGKILHIAENDRKYDTYILPGFIDAHVHIESSMLPPSEFARLAALHGTVSAVSDPHEIANVLGVEGVHYMIDNGNTTPFKYYFGVPSCVPATPFETAGAKIDDEDVAELLKSDETRFLSEVMNFTGVLTDDASVINKIQIARSLGRRIDGHSPGLRGEDLRKYIAVGISTDHECISVEEAREKLSYGMKIIIREGSAAKDFRNLFTLIEDFPDNCMICSDDIHPNDLVKGHINQTVKMALQMGIDRMKILRCACVNPVIHYGLDVGLLQKGNSADFIVIDDFRKFNILETHINGFCVAKDGRTLLPRLRIPVINNFHACPKNASDFSMNNEGEKIRVIEAIDGQIVTNMLTERPRCRGEAVVSDPERDILKLAVVNRYKDVSPSVAFIKGFGLKRGAIASSVAHDSHNIIAVGVDDEDLCRAVNLVIKRKGGLSVVGDGFNRVLPLPVAGIMSDKEGKQVSKNYAELEALAKKLGTPLKSPFMTLSFMALPVIPKIKLTDKGLFDGERFEFIHLFTN
jgi:adenine deaminase